MPRRTTFIALILIVVGIYFMLVKIGVGVPGFTRIWPVFLFLGGIVALGKHFVDRREGDGLIFWGTAFALGGLFLFLFTTSKKGPDLTPLRELWPVFIAIGGLSLLALWLVQGLQQDWELLFLAAVAMIFGTLCVASNLQVLDSSVAQQLNRLWPALIILVGLILLLRVFLGRKKTE